MKYKNSNNPLAGTPTACLPIEIEYSEQRYNRSANPRPPDEYIIFVLCQSEKNQFSFFVLPT